MSSAAQTVTDRFDFGQAERTAFSMPRNFSYNEIPYLMMYDDSDCNTVHLYDEDLEPVKTVAMKEGISFNYRLLYQDEERDVIEVTEVTKSQTADVMSQDEFVQDYKGCGFDESDLVISETGDGTRKISLDYGDGDFRGSNRYMYFGYEYFGKKYPYYYFIDNGSEVCRYTATYRAEYSEWRPAGTRTVDCSKQQDRIRLCNVNLNNGDGRAVSYFELSQTLFNDDEMFEYVMPKYKLSAQGNVSSSDIYSVIDYAEKIVTTRTSVISEQSELALAGFQVVSENGDVVSDIVFDGGFEGSVDAKTAYVITIGDMVYLAFDGYGNGQQSTIFYKIDKSQVCPVQKAKTAMASMRLALTTVNSGAPITVAFGDGNGQGSDIVMTSSAGVRVKAFHVPAGQTSAQIRVNVPAGIYCVSRLQKDRIYETKKIAVK